MQVRIVAVGRMKAGPERDLAARYWDRFARAGRAVGLQTSDIRELAESRAGDPASRQAEEARTIEAAIAGNANWFLLDERGDDRTSEKFAAELADMAGRGVSPVAFVIGGADGVAPDLRDRAPRTFRFGKATLPHQIVRILLCEQLYRAATILSGHPYHRSG
ncbi:MAG: 23S rRNA (pseudouridine(1915)-N(3))-methyltransferase RlmH [Pseudomonadota bacterium]